jgi:hypothetical protein
MKISDSSIFLKSQTETQVDPEMPCGRGNMSPQMVRLRATLKDLRESFENTSAFYNCESARA